MNVPAPTNLRRVDASRYLLETYGIPRSPRTLAKEACISSDGPPIIYCGRIPLYPISGLDDYAQRILSKPVRSTSERRVSWVQGVA